MTSRKKKANKKRKPKTAYFAEWEKRHKAINNLVDGWRMLDKSNHSFVQSLCHQWENRGTLTENQWQYVLKYAEILGRQQARRRSRSKPGGCYVYGIIDGDGHMKIGISTRPEKRLVDMQVAQAEALSLAWKVITPDRSAARWVEGQLHRFYRNANLRGEWFIVPSHEQAKAKAEKYLEARARRLKARAARKYANLAP